jgi:hypothetical protein
MTFDAVSNDEHHDRATPGEAELALEQATSSDTSRLLHCVSADRIRQAIRDPNLDRGHLKVLANIWERLNARTCTAWPSRERIAEEEGLDPKTVANKLYDLRRLGYITWERLPDPKKPNRTLLNYRWLQDEITEAVTLLRSKSARPTGQSDRLSERAKEETARSSGSESARTARLESALPSGNKELSEEGTLLEEKRNDHGRAHDIGGVDAIRATDDQEHRYHQLCRTWGIRCGESYLPPHRRETDGYLAAQIAAFSNCGPDAVDASINAALLDCEARQSDWRRSGEPSRGKGLSSFQKYFASVLRSAVDNDAIKRASALSKALSERHVQEQLHAKRVSGIQNSRGGNGRASRADEAAEAFGGVFQ